jgi:hypothetical protein
MEWLNLMELNMFQSRRYEKTPHVCFSAAGLSTKAEIELPRLLGLHFHGRFKSFWMMKWLSVPWAGSIQSEQYSHVVVLAKSKFKNNDWILIVSHARTSTLLDRVLKRKAVLDVDDIMLLCREIHALLISTGGITSVRWYLKGQTTAVSTPDELTRSQEA